MEPKAMIGIREFPTITTEDLMGVSFEGHPAKLPITSLYGHPAAAYLHSINLHMKAAIERAIMDLGYHYGMSGAALEWRGSALVVRIRYRGRA